jgi:hypothetical protein
VPTVAIDTAVTVDLTTAQTLTTKTLTSPVLTTPSISNIDAKGDILVGTADNTLGVITAGANGETLVADSSTLTGLKYSKNAPLGGMTIINAGGTALTGATTITISGFSNLSRLTIIMDQASAGANSIISVRFNSVSGTQYGYSGLLTTGGTLGSAYSQNATSIPFAIQGNVDANVVSGILNLEGAFSPGLAQYNLGSKSTGGGAAFEAFNWSGFFNAAAQITSVSLISSSGNFDAGTIYVFGA